MIHPFYSDPMVTPTGFLSIFFATNIFAIIIKRTIFTVNTEIGQLWQYNYANMSGTLLPVLSRRYTSMLL